MPDATAPEEEENVRRDLTAVAAALSPGPVFFAARPSIPDLLLVPAPACRETVPEGPEPLAAAPRDCVALTCITWRVIPSQPSPLMGEGWEGGDIANLASNDQTPPA